MTPLGAMKSSLFFSVLPDSTADFGIKGIAGLISILPFSASQALLHASAIAIYTWSISLTDSHLFS